MKIALLYNEEAGGGVTLSEIRHTIEQQGHELVCVVNKHDDAERVLDASADLVVAGGGDGTVANVVRVLAGRTVPLAILPLGTANNIADSLGYRGSIEHLIARWHDARRVPLDLGTACGSWGERSFVEGVGTGLIPAGISAMNVQPFADQPSPTAKLSRATRKYSEVLSRLEPRRLTLILDGIRTTGDFILVEILNIRSIGANIVLSTDADPSDGFFCVVMAGEEDRAAIARYLRHQVEGQDCRLSLNSQQVKHIEIQGATDVHVDDQVFTQPCDRSVSIRIEPAALEFWI